MLPSAVPRTTHRAHTMGSAVDLYAAQRVPGALLDQLVAGGAGIEVHGIYPDHLAAVMPHARQVHTGHAFGPDKRFNVVRPRFFTVPASETGRARLVVAVPPGNDYVLHYASLIRHYLGARRLPAGALTGVFRYPRAETSLADWTRLADLVEPGDRVLMGYVGELVPLLLEGGGSARETRANDFYGAVRVGFASGESVCALGVRFSFWGCIAARLLVALQRLGASEIVYAGKLGTLTSPDDIYRRLFVPSAYLVADSAAGVAVDATPRNALLEFCPALDSGLHMSVGTVLEEDVHQRAYADEHGVQTIDNEISQMAMALGRTPGGPRASFSALHFATDYLRRPGEEERRDLDNLTNHRMRGALRRKQRVLQEVAGVLCAYYGGGTSPAGAPRRRGRALPVDGLARGG